MKETIASGEEDNLERIKPIIDELKKEEVQAIYLFGSHAKGNARPTSDIDICVITEKKIPRGINEKAKVFERRNLLIGGCRGPGCVRFSANVYQND